MFLKTFPVGPFQCNCSILADEKTGEAIVVDPGEEAQKILNLLKEQGFIANVIKMGMRVNQIFGDKALLFQKV